VDFTFEVERAARVLDGAVIVVDAVAGAQAQTRTVWRQIHKQNVPAIVFVNKMDRVGADFHKSILSLNTKLGINSFAIQEPIGSEQSFSGVVDLISMHKIEWEGGKISTSSTLTNSSRTPGIPKISKIEDNDPLFVDYALKRKSMLEAIAELDEQFFEIYFSTETVSAAEILSAMRRICLSRSGIPVLCGASLRSMGVEPLLDSIVQFLPSPQDRSGQLLIHKRVSDKTKLVSSNDEQLCAMAFKIVNDADRGMLVFTRVFSGFLRVKQSLYNSTSSAKERVNQLLRVSADDFVAVQEIGPGDVCCIVGLK
jgi:elongation factor G